MGVGDILLSILLLAVMLYAARNLMRGLTSGRMAIPGGRSHDRARQPGTFWMGIVFEAVMVLLFGFLLVRQFA